MMGFILVLYEVGLWMQTRMIAQHTPPSVELCLFFKLLSAVCALATRNYVLQGTPATGRISLLLTGVYAVLWLASKYVLEINFTMLHVSPIPLAYCVVGHLALWIMGGHAATEVTRAQQLAKLKK
jgi:hypothetical protein